MIIVGQLTALLAFQDKFFENSSGLLTCFKAEVHVWMRPESWLVKAIGKIYVIPLSGLYDSYCRTLYRVVAENKVWAPTSRSAGGKWWTLHSTAPVGLLCCHPALPCPLPSVLVLQLDQTTNRQTRYHPNIDHCCHVFLLKVNLNKKVYHGRFEKL